MLGRMSFRSLRSVQSARDQLPLLIKTIEVIDIQVIKWTSGHNFQPRETVCHQYCDMQIEHTEVVS